MGEPVKIFDVAKKLISLAGFKHTYHKTGGNFIQIKEIGFA